MIHIVEMLILTNPDLYANILFWQVGHNMANPDGTKLALADSVCPRLSTGSTEDSSHRNVLFQVALLI